MHLKAFFTKTTLWSVAAFCLLVGFFVYATIDRTVYVTEQLVVIPDTVISDTWQGVENILVSDLVGDSLYQEFSLTNSAVLDTDFLKTPPTEVSPESPQGGEDASSNAGEGTGAINSDEGSEGPSDTTENELPLESEQSNETPVTEEPENVSEPAPEAESQAEAEVISTGQNSLFWGVNPLSLDTYRLAQETVTEENVESEAMAEPAVIEDIEETEVAPETIEAEPEPEEVIEETVVDYGESTEEVIEEESGEVTDEEEVGESGEGSTVTTDESAYTEEESEIEEEEVIEEEIVTTIYDACAGDEECKLYSTTFTGFAMPEFESDTFLASAQLRLSLAARTKDSYENGPQRFVVEYSYDTTGEWRTATIIDIEEEIANSINGGYFLVSLEKPLNQAQLANLQVRLSYQGNIADLERAYIESLWLEVTSARFYEETDPQYLSGAINYNRELESPKFHDLYNADLDPAMSELPTFTLSYTPQQNFLRRALTAVFSENEYSVDSVRIIDAAGEVITVPVDVQYHDDMTWTVEFLEQPQKMVPGKYTVELVIDENETLYTDSFEFYWGVLAVNTTKSMYFPGEDVTLNLAALTEKGDTICDAALVLKIVGPDYTITEVPVEQSGACGKNNVTDIPDYLAFFNDTNELGQYTIQLQHLNREGKVVHSIQDHFEVREYIPYDIERTAPTRIYPPAPYDVTLKIKANRVYTGDIVERVPRGFIFTETNGAEILSMPDYTELVWRNINLEEGDEIELSYQFDAPDISPYMYLLGPLNMDGFEELRQWQIASDALTASGVFSGTRTVASTNLNLAPSPVQWSNQSLDPFYFDHSTTTNSHEVTLRQSGDYYVAVTVPQIRTDGNNSRTRVGVEVRVNGVAVPQGLGRSAYIRNQNGHQESSAHAHFLLTNIAPDDVLEVYLEGLTTVDAGDIVNVSGQASMFLEYVGTGAGVFAATTTRTTNSTNLNQTTEYAFEWTETRQDSGFVHSDALNPEQIIISSPGVYYVSANIPMTTNTAQANILGRVRLDGVQVAGGQFKQGYVQSTANEGDGDSSMHWSGIVVSTTTNQVLTLTATREAVAGTVTVTSGFVGSVYIQQLPATEVIALRGTAVVGGTNWNPAAAAAVQWVTQTQKDATVFTHSTSTNSHQITIAQDGDYFFSYNDAISGAVARSNTRVEVLKNGTPIPGAQTKSHYIRNQNGHVESSGALAIVLEGLLNGDVITVTTIAEASAGTLNDDTDALLLMWKKNTLDLRPEAPATTAPFDNIRFASSTPYFDFQTTDPDGTSALEYEFSIATTTGFTASTTFNSAVDSEFFNTASSSDTSPFTEGNTIRFQLTSGDALGDQVTYYWRVRAKDVAGSGEFSDWSTTKSLTVDLAAAAPSWFQSFSGQFEGNSLIGTVSSGGDRVQVDASVSPEVLIAYGEGTNTAPRYRFWDGTNWGLEGSAQTVSGTINWVRTAASVSRDEYALITLDSASDSFVQIYSASTSSWANRVLMSPVVSGPQYRGVAVGYESTSGDLMAVSCTNSPSPVYRIWNGSSWSATSTIPVTSLNNCNFLELASDPASDEMILVVRDTGTQYEALVWNGSAWVESRVIGSSAKVAREGMSVVYEASGDQALVVVSNNTNNNIIYTTWNGVEFSTNATQALGNDFEFGRLSADTNSDAIALCYIDEDNDIGVLRWNGGVWAAAVELDTGGNGDTARPVDCEFETTAGRSDYLMAAYSDTTNVRYRAATSTVYSTEVTIGTVEDSFWVQTERAGDGKILMVALDDTVDNILSSVWNGTSWSAQTSLETSPSSVIAAPYEMYDMSAKRFQFSEGIVRTPPITFTDVPNQPTWGDINFSTTEPFGTDVQVRVRYSNVGTCDAFVPDLALPGNSGGFDVTESPINLVGLSTTTYSQLCLEATISTLGDDSAALEEWTLAWVRQPKLIQNRYRWYVNGSFLTPTDPWPAGVDDTAENTSIDSSIAINVNETIRLRMSLQGDNVLLPAFAEAFKLQYAEGFTCSNTLTWHDVGDIASTTALWRGYENSIVGDDWYSGSWPRRIEITVENGLVGTSSAITNYPVYVNLSDLPTAFFDNVQADGDDIRITTNDGVTEVPYELVSINTGTDSGELHFRAPSLSTSTDTSFFIYYGNPSASGYAANATYGSRNVWTNNYVAVYHLRETGSTAVDVYKDSTANQYHAQGGAGVLANVPTATTSGRIGTGQSFDGAGDLITNNLNATALGINGATAKTISAWTYARTFTNSGVFRLGSINTDGQDYSFRTLGAANQWRVQHWGTPDHDFTLTPSQNTWRLFSLAYDGTTSRLYGDGVLRSSEVTALNTTNGTTFAIGTWNGVSLNGIIDEVRISNVNRPLAWHQTEFNNQSNPTGFYSVSGEELISDGRLLPTTVLSQSDVAETYEEENPTRDNQNPLPVGNDAEWDFALQNNAASPNTNYCFRMVYEDGALLNTYDSYPRLITNAPPLTPQLEAPFDNERLASTTPWFEFYTDDELEDEVAYDIQVSTDVNFGSTVINNNSIASFALFTNLVQPAQKSQFTSGDKIRFISPTALSNGTTYWWRVRAQDPDGSGAYSTWSVPESFTVNTGTVITTWFQTTGEQFATNNLLDAVANASDTGIDTGFTVATTTSTVIDYDDRDTGNAWGELNFTDTGTVSYFVEYRVSGETFALVPDGVLPGNSSGFTVSPVSLVGLNPVTYNELRLVAVLSGNPTTPRLQDWTVTWSETIEIPTKVDPFDNAKVSTTTPALTFFTSDPENDDLQYELQLSSAYNFASPSTFTSGVNPGFTNTENGGDTSPFANEDVIQYLVQTPLTNGNTYWWRLRARDPLGSNSWSDYSTPVSFTVDTSITTSVWHQTTGEQFATDELFDIETTTGAAQITSVITEVISVYGEGTGQSPQYRLWNGTNWSIPFSAQSVGAQIRWLELKASPTRPEYVLGTLGTDQDINFQVYNAETDTWSDMQELQTASVATNKRTFNLAYETNSGDLLAIACNGTNATYSIWNGATWSAPTTLTLTSGQNCEFIQLASDPTSDEIIAVFRHAVAGTNDYQALVWNGSSWGNSAVFGELVQAGHEGMAVAYEESGGQAIVAVSNGANTTLLYNIWNGSSWSGTATQALGDHIEWASLKADVGTDRLALCYIDNDGDLGVLIWSGSAWNTFTELDIDGNDVLGRAIDCEWQVGVNDGDLLIAYSDTAATRYQTYNGTTFSGELTVTGINDTFEVNLVRAGDGLIHLSAYDDALTPDRINHSRWNGSGWTTVQNFSDNASLDAVSPYVGGITMAAQLYPNFVSGSIRSTPINFEDGTGPRWDFVSWNDTTPGLSTILYSIYYESAPGVFSLIPNIVLPGNSTGFATSPIDISSIDRTTYSVLALDAQFTCDSGNCPTLQDWTLAWSEGITVSGTAREFDGIATTTSGTVGVAVNGVLQTGKTGTILGDGSWFINNVTAFPGDTVVVFVDGAADTNESVAIATYDGVGNITGMELTKRHVTIGSNSAATTTIAGFAGYDNSDDEDIFFTVGIGNLFTVCAEVACADGELKITTGTTFAPGANVTTHDFLNLGSFRPATSTVRVSGSWNNQGTFVPDTSTVVFSATSTSESITTSSTTLAFYNLTTGEGSGTATWTVAKPLSVSNNLSVAFGTLARGTSTIAIGGNLQVGAAGTFTGLATTTFSGSGSHTWSDAKSATTSTNIGHVVIDGTAKTITLAGNVGAESVTIGADDTLNASGSGFNINVRQAWINNNSFIPQSGTVTFVGTSTGFISRGSSAFNNLAFTGVGGNWSFTTPTLALNGNLSIATGTVTLPTGTTTIAGSFSNTGGNFLHNNGEVRMTSTAGGRTITQRGTPFLNAFYDLVFAGSGSWSYGETAATTTRNFRIQSGTVTLPSGTLTVGGDYVVSGSGAFAHNNGEVILIVQDTDTVRANGSNFNNLRTTGTGSDGWYNDSFSYRLPITVMASSAAATLTDYPMYVDMSTLGNDFFQNVGVAGRDIRVTSADGVTELPVEVINMSTSTKTGELYFRAPTLSSTTDSTFYIYYGNPSATAYAENATFGAQNVWSNGYAAVYHLNGLLDSTANNRDLVAVGTPTLFGNSAYEFDGDTDFLRLPNNFGLFSGAVDFTTEISFEADAVAPSTDFATSPVILMFGDEHNAMFTFGDGLPGNTLGFRYQGWVTPVSVPNIQVDTPYQISLSYDQGGSGLAMYSNGTSVSTAAGNITVAAGSFDSIIGGTIVTDAARAFDGVVSSLRISSVARSAAWLRLSHINIVSPTGVYATSSQQGVTVRTFEDTNVTVLGNLVHDLGGDVVYPTGVLSVQGSFDNNATFAANNGTVRFNSPAGAETIAAGSSSFATLEFNSGTGDFTVTENATATVAVNLTSVQQFTLTSGRTLASLGAFNHAANGSNTTWTGSTLRLASGTSTALNIKTHGGDVYGTLEAASSTLVRMWNSSATSYVTSGATGAIYSQDHAGVDGDLNIYGNYTRTTGTEHWSYGTDFDGANLTGTERQVDVRIATSSQIAFTNASLNLLGSASASTTIDAQSGAFSLSATNTTMSAQFFTASGTDAFGFRLSASSTISLLQDGSFAVRAGRSALTLDASTIDTNPTAQYERIRFATTTAGTGTNVTVTGTPSSFIWFRNGSGNLYGEAFDVDPTGNPGSVRFDDSSYSVTVSGTVFSDDGITPMGAPVCNNASPVVTIAINGVPSFSGPCSSVNGTYSISGVSYSGDAKVAVFLDTNNNGTTTTALRSETTGVGTTAAGGTFTVNKPATVRSGDYLVAFIGKDDSVGITGPAGWTSYTFNSTIGNARHAGIWYKLVTDAATEPASYTFTGDATEVFSYWIGAISGISPTNPEDVAFTGRWQQVQNNTAPSAPSLTTTNTNSFVLSAWYVDTDATVTAPGFPWTTRAANVVSGENNNLTVSSRIIATAGVSGAAAITGVDAAADTTMAQFAFRRATATTSSVRAVTVTKTPSGNITGLNLYQNRVIVRHEDALPLTISDMTLYDADNDTDMLFTAATGTPNTLRLPANTELYVFANKIFAPGGNITLGGSANSNGYEGTLQLGSGATFTAAGTETHTLAGRFVMATTSTFTAASSTFIFNATTTGKSITSPNTVTFNQLQFAGTGGGWNITAPLIVLADMNIASGTVTGTSNITLQNGSLYGNGVLSLGSGTTTIARSNTFGGTTAWTLNNLIFGNGSVVGTTTPNTSATTTILGRLTIANAHFLDAGSSIWDLAGTGTVFTETGTFLEDTSTIRYSGASSNVLSTSYYDLLISAGVGSPTYTGVGSGILVLNNLTVGGGTNSTFTVNTTDQVLEVRGNMNVGTNGTFQASNSALLTVQGNFTNTGTFAGNNGTVLFNGTGTSNIAAGNTAFSNVNINGTGNYTLTQSATSTGNWSLIAHNNFTVNSGATLAIGGTFLNNIAGANTTWTGSTLRLYGTGTYEINDSATSDTYETLAVGANTHVRMWNSSATSYSVNPAGSLYSQDHLGVNGEAYVYGAMQRTAGDDFWSYSTDFDGTDLAGGSERQARVYFASGASATWSGSASLTAIGTTSATTTVENQGSGTYGITIGSGATTEWNRVSIRDIGSQGVVFSGTPTVIDFSRTDHLVEINNGSAITVGGTAINANEAKNFTNNIFNVSGASNPKNVTATGTAISSWRFTNHTGNIAGEAFDDDPAGDPGYVVWDDSAALITVSGNVYSDEGVTVSGECDGSTNNVRLVVAGLTTYDTSCNAGTGAYSISGVAYSPLDTLTLYLNGETSKAANVSVSPISSIPTMHLYHNRVIVRHENTDPITIANMAVWDSSDDADIPFTAVDSGTDTLTVPANTKLLIWTGKTFEPNGNVTLSGAGAGAAWDGTLEAQTNARFRARGTESHSVGGSVIFGTGAEFVAASSTLTLTTTGSARTFDVNANTVHNLTVSGSGSYVMSDATLTTTGTYAQSAGAVTFPTGTSTIGAAFNVTGGTFTNNGSPFVFTGSGAQTVRFNNSGVASLRFSGAGTFTMSDTNATSTGSVLITSGSVTLPSGNFAVGGNFEKRAGTLAHNTSDIIMTSATPATFTASSSDLFAVRFIGAGAFTITDTNITFLDSLTVQNGTVLMASGTTAVGGSLIATSGTFTHATGTVLFNASGSGRTIEPGQNTFHNLQIGAPAGGYTLYSATTTNNFTIANANILTINPGATIAVGGVFTNSVGGVATTWTGTTLRLTSGTAYSINTRVNAGDVYGTLVIGNNTDIRSWYSSAATTTVAASGSLYSQDNANVNGNLYIYGDLVLATSTEYWNYSNDFDGTVLTGGNQRAVSVFLAANATTTLQSGTLQILGASGFETAIQHQATGTYAFLVNGGTLNAQHYEFFDLNADGLQLSGLSTITNLANGYFDLAVNTGSLITLSSTTLNANPSKIFDTVGFTATTGISGFNVELVGETTNAWRFTNNFGNIGGEGFDIDGIDACGSIRFDNSACLLTEQTSFRWRADDGGEGAPNSEWFDSSFDYRTRVRIQNNDNAAYSTTSVKVIVPYRSGMQSDFDDLRFTTANGVAPVSFWLERYTASTEAQVWVQIPSLPASAQATVFMYYGSTTASSVSNGGATFNAFDDYEDANITEYSGDTGLFTTVTSPVYGGARALRPSNTSGRTTDGIFRFDDPVSQGQIIRYMQYVNTTAGSGDEPCTLFGVQSPGTTNQNYAVCLEQFGVDRISLSENVSDNDSSGTILASSTVTYATGWYEVEIDWRTNNSMHVYLYNAAGTLVASTTATDSSYTSGGFGYSFWFQNGAWDSFTSRPRVATKPTVYLGAEQTDGGASWISIPNGTGSAIPDDVVRLRVAIENGGLDVTGQQYRLEYAAKGVAPTCESVSSGSYITVPNQASCGSSPVCMQTSAFVSNGAVTTDLLFDTEGTFSAGEIVTNPVSQTSGLDVDQDFYTELEYVLSPTVNASDAYCFRVTNAGTPLDFYAKIAELGLQFDPTFGPLTLNGGLPISLTPGTTTPVTAIGTVTDFNGFTDITNATATIYRSGAGAACTPDNNNCYVASTENNQCTFINCSGNSCDLSCTVNVFFHADPTDADTYEGEEWLAFSEVEDFSGGYDFASAPGVELNTLRALAVDSLINYGALAADSDTGSFNPTTTVTNLGNVPINIDIEGNNLTDGGSSEIGADLQKVATSTFTYNACVTCQQLSSSSAVTLGINLSKPSVVVPPVETEVYWGIAVPFSASSAAHSGTNIFTAIGVD